MSVNIEMPKLSDTMTEGTLIKWHKKVGDSVEIGDILAEVETDKATMEMEAFDDGIITEILISEGEKASIGSVLAVLDGDSGSTGAALPATAAAQVAPVAVLSSAQMEPSLAPESITADRLKTSPLARKIAMEKGINLEAITGTGPAGRIVKKDVETASISLLPAKAIVSSEASAAAALAASVKAKAAAPAPISAPAAAPTPQAINPVAKEGDEIVQLSSMRKIIASRLLTSKTTIPHFYLHLEVDAAPLMALRQQVNAQAEQTHGNKYSVNDFILKAVINATEAVPAVNSSYAGDHIVKFKHVGLSVAIAVEDGLVTPVIKQAETKSLLAISRAVKDFAVRAKDKKLKPDEFDGGTITVSNLGAWGIESFDAIVNPPQAAILSVGAAIEKPVVKNGQIVPGLRMNLGLSCDHRVVDGAVAAQFLAEIKKLIEQPALMLL
ncbi:MAG: 2-oxo acid dehydrogenase subunit E2 [Akkermansiaceae bacterium]|nr:2-oxo acid dehydrogenase subunit E2 [Akkermansiaceae bacterium]